MTTGRVMVVLTEFVVLLAFGSRFYFDKKLNDLTETIDQKISQIENYGEVENQMRILLTKQLPINEYLTKSIMFSKKYDGLTKAVPVGVKLEKVFFDQNTMRITGKSDSELGFAQLLRRLKSMESLTYMNIRDVYFDQNTKVVMFTIQANFK